MEFVGLKNTKESYCVKKFYIKDGMVFINYVIWSDVIRKLDGYPVHAITSLFYDEKRKYGYEISEYEMQLKNDEGIIVKRLYKSNNEEEFFDTFDIIMGKDKDWSKNFIEDVKKYVIF